MKPPLRSKGLSKNKQTNNNKKKNRATQSIESKREVWGGAWKDGNLMEGPRLYFPLPFDPLLYFSMWVSHCEVEAASSWLQEHHFRVCAWKVSTAFSIHPKERADAWHGLGPLCGVFVGPCSNKKACTLLVEASPISRKLRIQPEWGEQRSLQILLEKSGIVGHDSLFVLRAALVLAGQERDNTQEVYGANQLLIKFQSEKGHRPQGYPQLKPRI